MTDTLREDLPKRMSLVFIIETECLLYEVRAEAEEKVDCPKVTTKTVFSVKCT
jgi:hypothetical protein